MFQQKVISRTSVIHLATSEENKELQGTQGQTPDRHAPAPSEAGVAAVVSSRPADLLILISKPFYLGPSLSPRPSSCPTQ